MTLYEYLRYWVWSGVKYALSKVSALCEYLRYRIASKRYAREPEILRAFKISRRLNFTIFKIPRRFKIPRKSEIPRVFEISQPLNSASVLNFIQVQVDNPLGRADPLKFARPRGAASYHSKFTPQNFAPIKSAIISPPAITQIYFPLQRRYRINLKFYSPKTANITRIYPPPWRLKFYPAPFCRPRFDLALQASRLAACRPWRLKFRRIYSSPRPRCLRLR